MTDDQSITTDFNAAAHAGYAPLASLKPGQPAVGMLEVEHKCEKLRAVAKDHLQLQEFLVKRPINVALGPQGSIYIIDRHHLALALIKEGYKDVAIKVDYDFSGCTQKQFWQKMQENKLLNLYDENGQKKDISVLPGDLWGLRNDPYRSLAWFVREAGGYDKLGIPFMEFAWANYFREHIDLDMINNNFDKALKQGLKWAKNPAADGLPGYNQPSAAAAFALKKKKQPSNK